MPNTREILDQMFVNLVKVKVDQDTLEKMVPVVDGLLERLRGGLNLESEQAWNRLRIALAGMLAHGWALRRRSVFRRFAAIEASRPGYSRSIHPSGRRSSSSPDGARSRRGRRNGN